MYLCYIDESGTADIPGNTSHFVLAGLSIPIWKWKDCDKQIEAIKRRYALVDQEIHVAWILRSYLEQTRIPDFDALDHRQRRSEVERLRKMELLRLQRSPNKNQYRHAWRRYLENNEEDLFDLIFQRADRKDDKVVGIRHFTRPGCACKICAAHRKSVGL